MNKGTKEAACKCLHEFSFNSIFGNYSLNCETSIWITSIFSSKHIKQLFGISDNLVHFLCFLRLNETGFPCRWAYKRIEPTVIRFHVAFLTTLIVFSNIYDLSLSHKRILFVTRIRYYLLYFFTIYYFFFIFILLFCSDDVIHSRREKRSESTKYFSTIEIVA